MLSKFNSVDSIVNYLRGPVLSSTVVNSTTTSSHKINNGLKSSKKQRKDKDIINVMSTTPCPPFPSQPQLQANIEILPKGRVRYGPVTVNPRKQPSKTLFTGRRSKYEVLSNDEDEKRRERRERNRVAATKCREKRETVLSHLEHEYDNELANHKRLLKIVNDCEQQKNYLESVLTNHLNECPLVNNSSPRLSMIFGDTGFLSSIIDTAPPPPPTQQQLIFSNDEEELSHILEPTLTLTNSAYDTDSSNSIFLPQQQPPQVITMTSSSIERLINSLQSPTISMEGSNNHSMLFNSAVGSSCAKQHSSSSEDDSLPPKLTNPCVY